MERGEVLVTAWQHWTSRVPLGLCWCGWRSSHSFSYAAWLIQNYYCQNFSVLLGCFLFKNRDITLSTKVRLVKAMVFPVVMYGCESWTIKKAEHWRIDAFELWCWRRLLSPLDCKEIQPVNPKGNQSWLFVGRTDVEAETPILWPPDAKSWLIWKDPDSGKDWGQEEKGTTEDEMVGWHHRHNGHGFGWTPMVMHREP